MENELNKPIDYQSLLPKHHIKGVAIPIAKTSEVVTKIKDRMFDMKGAKSILKGPDCTNVVLINPKFSAEEISAELGIPASSITEHEVQTTINNLNYQDVLRLLLPSEVLLPSSFEIIGHVALLNLRPVHLPYKYLIGKAILDTSRNIKTVVNKYDKLKNVFRTPALELIAGELNYETMVNEESVRLFLNVEQVYFCSRLHYERSRVLQEVKPKSIIADVFCGIGPFAVRAAKEKSCKVWANDLNPECFKYLQTNIKKNKLDKLVTPFCMDGREFISLIFDKVASGEILVVDHFYMNLPALAIDFLDAFNNVGYKTLPFDSFKIHVYCFQPKEETEDLIIEKVKERIVGIMSPIKNQIEFTNFNFVKNVSTTKAMLCASFRVSKPLGQPLPEPGSSQAEVQLKKTKEVTTDN
jgi:tRNA (guanine37-N1)-methyltransferase